jgi:ABC-2 type transport system permease protein
MTALLATETLKLRTLVLPLAVLAVGAVGSAVIGWAGVQIAAGNGETPTLAELAVAPSQPLWFLAVIVAVLATAGEFQHGTLAATLLQVPRRGGVLAAKAVVAAAYGAVLAALGAAVAMLTGAVAILLSGGQVTVGSGLVRGIAGGLVLAGLWAVLAVGLGALVRSSTVALVAVLVWKFVVEELIPIVTRTQEVQPWLPSGAADAVLSGDNASGLSPAVGGLVFAGYTAAIVLAGALVFIRRDPA